MSVEHQSSVCVNVISTVFYLFEILNIGAECYIGSLCMQTKVNNASVTAESILQLFYLLNQILTATKFGKQSLTHFSIIVILIRYKHCDMQVDGSFTSPFLIAWKPI